MDLRDLGYFETIAELQHVGRASAKLRPTQTNHRTHHTLVLAVGDLSRQFFHRWRLIPELVR